MACWTALPVLFGLVDLLQGRVEVQADECLAFEGIGEMAVPGCPQAVARVAFEGAVVNLLREGDGRFDDHVGAAEHPREPAGARGQGDAVADGQAHGAAADELGNGHQDRQAFLGPDADHGARVGAQSGDLLEGRAMGVGHGADLPGQMFDPEPHRVAQVSGGLDDRLAFRPVRDSPSAGRRAACAAAPPPGLRRRRA